jgi:hypothetical protein
MIDWYYSRSFGWRLWIQIHELISHLDEDHGYIYMN